MARAAAAAAVVLLAVAIVTWLLVAPRLRIRRHRQAAARPLSASRRAVLDRNVPLLARLPPDLRVQVDGLVNAFVQDKEFVGCNGLVVTDEMRVTIAAHACVLVAGRPNDLYAELRSILVYPTPFWVEEEDMDETGVVTSHRRVLSGQAWESSRILLSWQDVVEAAAGSSPGYNLVLHEFAHYLDYEGLSLAPRLSGPGRALDEWARQLDAEFEAQSDAVDRGEQTFLDPYAAEDPAEFFAVASEEFLERPGTLRGRHPVLYGLLAEFYGLDPASWPAADSP